MVPEEIRLRRPLALPPGRSEREVLQALRGLADTALNVGDDISATINHEARVVYASFLLDQNRPLDAWPVIKPGRLVASPSPGELRRWYVAARVALEAGDKDAARRLVAALDEQEPDFEGVDELRRALA